jgi:phospholipid/cholesterol/gamma-HCH transport system ATP-binding protein
MIQIENLNKSFGTRQVLFDISTTFDRGKCNLIIGASGCGKSVLLKCILGLEEPGSGNIYYDGRNFTQSNLPTRKNIRKEVGVVFQGNALFDSLTVEQNVRFPLEMNGIKNKGEIEDRVNFCLRRVNLSNTNHLFPAEISGGMKKRVAIARAIALNPKYLLLDEPNSGLDPQTSIVIDQLIEEITKEYNITTIVVTHDMNSVMEIGDTVAFFYKGKLWWKGNKNNIVQEHNKELDEFVYASTFMRRFKETYN